MLAHPLAAVTCLSIGLAASGLVPVQAAVTPPRPAALAPALPLLPVKSLPPRENANQNILVVNFARSKMGQTVGGGECTELVDAALAYAQKQPGHGYVWGTEIDMWSMRPGDIIQFWDVTFSLPDGGTWGTAPGGRHTAIVRHADGSGVMLVHQNDVSRSVTQRPLDLAWPHSGSFNVYRPVDQ
jgi:hypothetical protein